ncbi:MAG: hypothetical protein M5U24_16000 [Candidatus Kuenenia sp.]|uniref:hypothetical protein n=1 Tax=Candidatus Kuenenia sp. TaxID=2499824 RepID=UPI0022C092A0|nr:hypothetical protein [Candidatus Kuenenia sp.]MCZ7623947.1 hypothetical protein [Candidatus Kuenenia sp.]
MIEIKMIPHIVMAAPTGIKSNMQNGNAPDCSRYAAMIIFGGVPINVSVPPNNDPKASGISRNEGERPPRRDIHMATGMSSAKAPTLFINPELRATIPVRVATWIMGWLPTRVNWRASESTTPALSKPRLSTRTAATVMTAGCPKPANTWLGGTSPATATTSRATSATIS